MKTLFKTILTSLTLIIVSISLNVFNIQINTTLSEPTTRFKMNLKESGMTEKELQELSEEEQIEKLNDENYNKKLNFEIQRRLNAESIIKILISPKKTIPNRTLITSSKSLTGLFIPKAKLLDTWPLGISKLQQYDVELSGTFTYKDNYNIGINVSTLATTQFSPPHFGDKLKSQNPLYNEKLVVTHGYIVGYATGHIQRYHYETYNQIGILIEKGFKDIFVENSVQIALLPARDEHDGRIRVSTLNSDEYWTYESMDHYTMLLDKDVTKALKIHK